MIKTGRRREASGLWRLSNLTISQLTIFKISGFVIYRFRIFRFRNCLFPNLPFSHITVSQFFSLYKCIPWSCIVIGQCVQRLVKDGWARTGMDLAGDVRCESSAACHENTSCPSRSVAASLVAGRVTVTATVTQLIVAADTSVVFPFPRERYLPGDFILVTLFCFILSWI